MSNEIRSPGARRRGSGERIADWADSRLGSYGAAKAAMRSAFPDRWSFMLGQIWLYSFIVLVLTGIYLSCYFHPSAARIQYNGSYAPLRGQRMSEAFNSTLHISFDVRGGLLMRQAHHWAALVFVAALLTHLMRVLFTGAFRKPRELNWVIGFLLLVLGMFAGLTGYDLPDDLLSGTGLAVVNGVILSVPIVGSYLSMSLFGGEFPGHEVISHFNTIHVLILPALMAALIAAYAALHLRHGPAQYPGPGRTNRNVVGLSPGVYAVKSSGYFFAVTGIIFCAAAIAQIDPIWLYGPYRPDQVSSGSQPDWYMAVADGFLRVMPGWEVNVWGHTLVLDNLIPAVAGTVFFLALGCYPFIESWITDDDHDQNLLDRPRNRPVRTGLGAAWLSVYVLAMLAAANDLVATHFHVSVNAVTWAVRISLFVVPPATCVLAKRWALGLQRSDRDKVLHGRETGIIKRLVTGEFVEVHEPLDRARLHVLTAHQQFAPLSAVPAVSPENGEGVPGKPTVSRRLKARLSEVYYGEGAQVPKATVDEYNDACKEVARKPHANRRGSGGSFLRHTSERGRGG